MPMTKREPQWLRWTCPHGFETDFFPVPGEPNLIAHRSCGICCEEISEMLDRAKLAKQRNPT